MPTPRTNAKSIRVAIRFPHDTYGLLNRDAKKVRGVATVVNAIVERHYEPKLKKIRERKLAKTEPKIPATATV